ncbi:DHA2 family efflux MFS transporter permease subunit [Mycetocola manganoxydans]|uniref:DHA2 family efflux MFS transporter permease subunit n=1 Tax=Mycetocola manganoxydans TaxID=699879 RepID=A0A3L6ZTR8_9MICO|nr:DHA2 family efflux MFS transporter permease subunit [Mycetocola manganoxydans]RLP71383.1 DHA2 family efflux MFS transporter permease subunit [Mycetocola manganoxydans]GHD46141.1 MFS transporter [Mycetocola manganoxydans]
MSRSTAAQKEGPEDASLPLRARWSMLTALSLVTFLLLADDTALSVALPSIQQEFGVGLDALQWIVNAYTLSIAAFTLLGGRLADRHGAGRIFLLGLAVFVAGSLIGGLVRDAPSLIGARALQGLGAALVAPAALALIATAFPARQRGVALGVWAGVSASALGIGPLFGAVVNDSFGWPWIFLLNVPLGALAWLVTRLVLPQSQPAPVRKRIDPVGVLLSAIALVGLVLAVNQSSNGEWFSPPVVILTAITIASSVLFVVHERRTRQPLVDLALFRSRVFTGAILVTLLSTAVMCSLFYFLALYLQTVLGLSSLEAALSLLPLTITIVLVAPIAGLLADRFTGRTIVTAGMLLLAAGLIGLGTLGLGADAGALAFWLALAGVGIGIARTPTTAAALGSGVGSEYGMAAGVLNSVQATGLALGIAVMSVIIGSSFGPNAAFDRDFDAAHHAAFLEGLSIALTLNAGIAVVAAALAAVLMRPGPQRGT